MHCYRKGVVVCSLGAGKPLWRDSLLYWYQKRFSERQLYSNTPWLGMFSPCSSLLPIVTWDGSWYYESVLVDLRYQGEVCLNAVCNKAQTHLPFITYLLSEVSPQIVLKIIFCVHCLLYHSTVPLHLWSVIRNKDLFRVPRCLATDASDSVTWAFNCNVWRHISGSFKN